MFKEKNLINFSHGKEGGHGSESSGMLGRVAKSFSPLATPSDRANLYSDTNIASAFNERSKEHAEAITTRLADIVDNTRTRIVEVLKMPFIGIKKMLSVANDLGLKLPVTIALRLKGALIDAPTKALASILVVGTHKANELIDLPFKTILNTHAKVQAALA